MTKLPKVMLQTAAAAALVVSAVSAGAGVAVAQNWSHIENRCTNDACATFRCDWNDCRRISAWRYNNDRSFYRGYYTERERTYERCELNRCATFRCDADGDQCVRVSDWRDRY
jgi:hypothetical protein